MGRCISNIYDFFHFYELTHVFLLIWKFLINALANFSNINKNIIRIKETFHLKKCINFSICYEEIKHLDVTPSCYLCTLQNNLALSTTITPQGIVGFHHPPLFVMISKKFRKLELEYLPINNPSIFLLTLRHIKT